MSTPETRGQLNLERDELDLVTPECFITTVELPNPETTLYGQEPQELQNPESDDPLEGPSTLRQPGSQ